MSDSFFKDHKELHSALCECLKIEVATLVKHAKNIGITQHTLINFLKGSNDPSRITCNKIIEYINKIQKKREQVQRKESAPVLTKPIKENLRDEILEVFSKFKRSYQEWSHDIDVTPEQLVGFIITPEDSGDYVIDKVKQYLFGIKVVRKMIDKIENHDEWDK